MFKILLGFLPWILYFVIVGKTREQHQAAIIVALATTMFFDFQAVKKGFVLTWGTILFFTALLLTTFFVASNWPETHATLLANTALAVIAWFSLLIKKPFTLQYARESVAEELWETPGFIFVNQIITLVWAICFLLQIVLNIYENAFNQMVYQVVSYVPGFVAIWFTSVYPNWYRGYRFRVLSRDKEDISKNRYLQGNYAPIKTEIDVLNVSINGTLPADLSGTYMRNGPNPLFDPISYTYPIDGDGMIHAVKMQDGQASYHNRFVETKGLLAEKKAGKALYGGIRRMISPDPKLIGKDGDQGPTKNGAFIHVIRHANTILAMYEAGIAYEITLDLKTVGPWCPPGATTPFNINAHTRYDAKTAELFGFTYNLHTPFLQYYVLNAQGQVTHNVPVEKPYSSMMHDFVLTENHIVFFDCPAIFDFKGLKKRGSALYWDADRGTTIRVVGRKNNTIITIETEPFFVYHFANAFEKSGKIIVHYVRHEKLSLGDAVAKGKPPLLYRAIIDINAKTVVHEQCDDRLVEFPRINDQFQAMSNQFIYMPSKLSTSHSEFNALIKYDTHKRSTVVHNFGDHAEIDEAVFIPRATSKREDDGYLGLFVYDNQNQRSEFVLLPAEDITEEPIARIQIPQRVPHGLHGNWMPN